MVQVYQKNDRPAVAAADLPKKRKILAGPFAAPSIDTIEAKVNDRAETLARVYRLLLAGMGEP